MDRVSAFFAMGGYGVFIWPAYGVSFVVIAIMAGTTIVRRRRVLKRLAALTAASGSGGDAS